jgi:hypothetical protein
MAKHDEAELELLNNLFSFIKKKHSSSSITEIENKFGTSARELVDIGEISELSLIKFCEDEGLDIPPKKKKMSDSSKKSTSSYGRFDSNPCGSGGSSYRGGC